MAKPDAITAIEGIAVGHWDDPDAATGCTVVLCPDGAVASADVRGGAPGTRETDLLRPGNLVEQVHAVLLTGGSAFGLDAATGVMRWLEERGAGFPTGAGPVPIVTAAVLYDLSVGRPDVRPDAAAGYAACEAAATGRAIEEGSVGAGTGASVGKALGPERAVKGGVGTACEGTASGVAVAALVAVNCFGEVVDPETGRVIAGPRGEKKGFESTIEALRAAPPAGVFGGVTNSTIGVVATDAALAKAECLRLAAMAQNGLARVVRPAHTQVDGDTLFALATGRSGAAADLTVLGALAARAVERAIVRAVTAAKGLAGVPAASEWLR
ncbi:MAG: P1 family peptidase [Chloroflexi bacterium]|nr:P1 family peptidase [Chloroflexota bacterium]